eukprot:6335029-Prymnesium_polylepis.3
MPTPCGGGLWACPTERTGEVRIGQCNPLPCRQRVHSRIRFAAAESLSHELGVPSRLQPQTGAAPAHERRRSACAPPRPAASAAPSPA